MYFDQSGFRLFSIAGIEVSVSFWYALLMGFIIFSNPGVAGLMFALAVTISIIIHEFGHAVPSKIYKLSPSILLHGFGGVCRHQPADSDWKDIIIVLLGPIVQIVVGGIVLLATLFFPQGTGIAPLESFLTSFIWFSIVWGLVNLLLPIFPLDGGQLFHMLLRRFMVEHKAQDLTLKTSILIAIVCGVYALTKGFFFGAFMAAFITMGNVATLQSGARLVDRKAKVRASDYVKDTLAAAEAAYADEDWREAARLCHVLRSANDPVPTKQMDRLWEILAVSTVKQGEFEEARGWLKRAPDSAAVREAKHECDEALG